MGQILLVGTELFGEVQGRVVQPLLLGLYGGEGGGVIVEVVADVEWPGLLLGKVAWLVNMADSAVAQD